MTKKAMLIGSAVAVVLAVPAIAQMAKPEGPPQTRAAAEAKVRSHFAKIDADKDGFVTAQDISAMRAQVKEKRFERLDADDDGSISRTEFANADAGVRRGGPRGAKMSRMGGRLMMMADTDKDGRIALNEAVAGAMTMFDRADADEDGTLTSDERRAARQAMRNAWRARTTS